jgi:hypothetical protein
MNKYIFIFILFVFSFVSILCKPAEKTHPLTDGQKGEDGVYSGYTFSDIIIEHSGIELEKYPKENSLNGVYGEGDFASSTDVFVVGDSEYVIFSWNDKKIINMEGDDLKIFENGFYISGTDNRMSLDLGMVEVSKDGNVWLEIPVTYTDQPYQNSPDGKLNFIGTETVKINFNDEYLIKPQSIEAGGDSFDLSDAGIDEGDYIKYVKVIDAGDLYPDGQIGSNGVDIDGICAFYWLEE